MTVSLEAQLDEAFHGEVQRRATSVRGIIGNLRLHARYRLLPVIGDDLLDNTGGEVPDCTRCQDTCCRGSENRITLRLTDLARLLDHDLAWAVDVDKHTAREVYARFFHLEAIEALDSNRKLPALKQHADGRCVLLDDDGRCSVYGIRPLRCRRFPYRLDDELSSISYAARCASRQRGTEQERKDLRADVVNNYNEKLKDLLLLEHGRPALARLGLAEHLPDL